MFLKKSVFVRAPDLSVIDHRCNREGRRLFETGTVLTEDRSTLSVLESLTITADMPQRKIAESTGLNLAKVNFVLRRLVEKGFVKLNRVRDNPHKLRYLYLLTPEGLAEKSRLTYGFLQRTLKEYGQAERKVADSVESMIAQGVQWVVLWGNNEITDLCLRVIERLGRQLKVIGVIDHTGKHPLALHPSGLVGMKIDAAVVCDGETDGIPPGVPIWRLA